MAEIYLHNTLSGKKQAFTPIKKGSVGMYHCGPTVYGKTHIGHARPYVFADILRRLFEYQEYQVTQVINITDVGHLTDDGDDGDDKLEKSAAEQAASAQQIAEKYTHDFFETLTALHIPLNKIKFPKATDHILEQIELIEQLEALNLTYQISDGVYFDTSKFSDYGKLGNVNIEHLQEGARVAKNSEKKNPTDFALWKFSPKGTQRQQEWNSPWGVGFPGWHIECSAMSQKYLGTTFDIHTGGIDHIPTHHNNEIAQSESISKQPLANYWLHVNHILIDNQKISKSLNNGVYFEDLEEKNVTPLAYRYWLLTADYKTLMNFTWDAVQASNTAYQKLIEKLARLPDGGSVDTTYQVKMLQSINDDINTAHAIALMWDLLKDADVSDADKKATIIDIDRILGLNLDAVSNLAAHIFNQQQDIPENVMALAKQREVARKNKDWEQADTLRDELAAAGYQVIDGQTNEDGSPKIESVA